MKQRTRRRAASVIGGVEQGKGRRVASVLEGLFDEMQSLAGFAAWTDSRHQTTDVLE